MKHFCAALILTLTAGLPSAFAEPFAISSEESAFAMVGTFTGDYSKKWAQVKNATRQVIEVKLDEGVLLRSPSCPNKTPDNVIQVRAFLGVPIPGKSNFDVINYSEPVEVGKLLQVNEKTSLKKVKFLIPIHGVPAASLKKAWLGFSIYSEKEGAAKGRGGTCYAHSPTLIFSKEPSQMAGR